MARKPDAQTIEQAIAWHLRLQNADGDAWGDFAEWLEIDTAHNDAYEAVVDEEARLAPLLREASFPEVLDSSADLAANDDSVELTSHDGAETTARRTAGRMRWGAVAASLVVAGMLAFAYFPAGHDIYTVETGSGQTKTVVLADGSEIRLNGQTRLELDRNDERTAKLLSGEARFAVTHDEDSPFTVISGDRRLVDIGTVFNVVKSGPELRVAVAEGAVRFEGLSQSMDLKAGDALFADASGSIRTARQSPVAIGSWADGLLVYEQTPLGLIGEDLARSLGVSVNLPASLRSKPFSGVIQTGGGNELVRQRVEELLGLEIMTDGKNWTVQP